MTRADPGGIPPDPCSAGGRWCPGRGRTGVGRRTGATAATTGKLFRPSRPTVVATSACTVLHRRAPTSTCVAGAGESGLLGSVLAAGAGAPMAAAGALDGLTNEPVSARVFVCARCRAEVVVCSGCDRGRRYCGRGCSAQARRASMLEAGRRYQSSRVGRFAHASRSKRYRQRQRLKQQPPPLPPPWPSASASASAKIVTHQCSQATQAGDVLSVTGKQSMQDGTLQSWRCCWCSRTGQGEVRGGFLRHGRPAHPVAHWSRRGTPHGP